MSPVTAPVRPALPEEAAPFVEAIDRWLAPALEGDAAAVRAFMTAWRRMSQVLLLLEAGAADVPAVLPDVLAYAAIEAPFSPWLTAFGPGRGAGLLLLTRIRAATGAGALPEPRTDAPAYPHLDRLDFARFARHVWLELQSGEGELARLSAAWELSQTEVARLFGVKRQAVAQWLRDGVPPARQPKLLTIARIADLLERNLLPERIPAVVRSPAEAYGGSTVLASIADDRQDGVLASIERSLDWAAGA